LQNSSFVFVTVVCRDVLFHVNLTCAQTQQQLQGGPKK